MATSPLTPVKKLGDEAPVTPALTRGESAGSPATPATPSAHTRTPTPTSAATFIKGSLRSSLKQKAAEEPKQTNDDFDIEIPPWDRTAELVWTKGIATSDNKLWHDELCFQENTVRMAASEAKLRPSTLHQSTQPRAKQTSLLTPGIYSKEPQRRNNISGKDNGLYFKLPDRVRLKIAKRIIAFHSSGKPIRLNSPVFFKPIWPVNGPPGKAGLPFYTEEYFDSLHSVLYQLDRYLSVCFAMRIDILTTLFLTRRFHVIYSPMVKPLTCPLATRFMDKYGVYMKLINLEIDLTKFGGNFHPASATMDFSLSTIRAHVERFVEGQLSRHGGTTLQSLIVMVRRYHGVRPGTEELVSETKHQTADLKAGEGKVEPELHRTASHKSWLEYEEPKKDKGKGVARNEPLKDLLVTTANSPTQDSISTLSRPVTGVPYCPDANLSVLDPLQRLGIAGLVDNLCLVGASKSYANNFIEAFLTREQIEDRKERQRLCRYRNPPRAYPLTPGQRSAINHNGAVLTLVHETDAQKWQGLYGVGVTEHWRKFDAGPFNFKPTPVKIAKVEEPSTPRTGTGTNITEEFAGSSTHKRRFSASSRITRRRRSSTSLLQLANRTSATSTYPGSSFGSERNSKKISNYSIPPLRSEPSSSSKQPSLTQNVLLPSPDIRRTRSMSSKIPVPSKKQGHSPPVFRSSTCPLSRKSLEGKRPKTPISLPYDKGHLVSSNRSVSGHRYGLTRIKDTVLRKMDEVMARDGGGGTGVKGSSILGSCRGAARSETSLPGSTPVASNFSQKRRASTRSTKRETATGATTDARSGSTASTGIGIFRKLSGARKRHRAGSSREVGSSSLGRVAENSRNLRFVASERGSLRPEGAGGTRTLRGVASEQPIGSLRGSSSGLQTMNCGSGAGSGAGLTSLTRMESAAGTSKGKGKEVDRG